MLPFIYGPFYVSILIVATNKLPCQYWTPKNPDLNNNNFRNCSLTFLSFH